LAHPHLVAGAPPRVVEPNFGGPAVAVSCSNVTGRTDVLRA
jgi:hypothetical protein